MTKLNTYPARVVSLRAEISNDQSLEDVLRGVGHRVTVLSSTQLANTLVASSWPDVVMFDPISPFGMSASIQRVRESFNGVVIAAGVIQDPTINLMLEELGITYFAETAADLLRIVNDAPSRGVNWNETDDFLVAGERAGRGVGVNAAGVEKKTDELAKPEPAVFAQANTTSAAQIKPGRSMPSIKLASLRALFGKPRVKRWHRTAFGVAVIAAVVVAVALPFLNPRVAEDDSVARALPVVPGLLTKPLVPLTIEELSGEILPLEIQGIKDRAVIEKPAVAFWGDTAPDAFVTVNGIPVEVSEYGAFVVDIPLEDGANFIEVLASDFQGRTTNKSFTIVSLQ